jgi:hypothetical protein
MQESQTRHDKTKAGTGVRIAASALVVWAAVVLTLWPTHGRTLGWDEVDYVQAARKGVAANALERDSLSASEFYRFARSKQAGGEPVLPAGYDEAKDPFLLRHFHPPLAIYMTSVVASVIGAEDERAYRAAQLLGALVFIVTLLLSYRWLTESPTWAGLLIVSALAYWLSLVLFASLAMHGWMAVWTVAASAFASRWISVRGMRVGLLLCVCLAFSLLTLETGVVALAGVFVSLALWGRVAPTLRSRELWRDTAVGVVIVALVVVALWPGAVLKISLAKALAMHVYRVRLGQEYAAVGEKAGRVYSSLYAPMLLALAACAWLFATQRAGIRRWGAFFVLGAISLLVMVKFAVSPMYLAPGLAPFACLAGYACDRFGSARARAFVAAFALVVVAASPLLWLPPGGGDPVRGNIRLLREKLRGREALVDGANIYGYYLGDSYTIRPATVSYDGRTLSLRERGKYEAVTPATVAGKVVVLVARTHEPYPLERELLGGCSRQDGKALRVYDCATGGH